MARKVARRGGKPAPYTKQRKQPQDYTGIRDKKLCKICGQFRSGQCKPHGCQINGRRRD